MRVTVHCSSTRMVPKVAKVSRGLNATERTLFLCRAGPAGGACFYFQIGTQQSFQSSERAPPTRGFGLFSRAFDSQRTPEARMECHGLSLVGPIGGQQRTPRSSGDRAAVS
jgi:hypothetical protein